jgi:hypothetical protein
MSAIDVECGRCHALFWQEEHNFINCCKQGEIVLPPVREPPDLLKRLLTRDHPNSDSFIKHIRQYNSALAFTSIAYTPDRRLRANEYNPTFQIQGELHYLQGPLNLQAGREPIYAQYFIYDPDEASRRRLTRNTELSQSLLRELDIMIRQFNSHYRIFKTAREILNEISNSQSTRIIITPRLQLIIEHGADQRRENLPVADEIALLLPGEENDRPRREIILTARPARDITSSRRKHFPFALLHSIEFYPGQSMQYQQRHAGSRPIGTSVIDHLR